MKNTEAYKTRIPWKELNNKSKTLRVIRIVLSSLYSFMSMLFAMVLLTLGFLGITLILTTIGISEKALSLYIGIFVVGIISGILLYLLADIPEERKWNQTTTKNEVLIQKFGKTTEHNSNTSTGLTKKPTTRKTTTKNNNDSTAGNSLNTSTQEKPVRYIMEEE